jgi:DMSO reductase anchor subunit
MHPAASVILFTVTSGAGYGLLFWLALLGCLQAVPLGRGVGLAGFGAAILLITAGLLASTFHLGHPERAWRALTQWRSSWLSREGVLALLVYPPALTLAAGWLLVGHLDGLYAAAGWATALLVPATVLATAMIYASLKPIPQWRNRWVPAAYLALALASGGLWLGLLGSLFGAAQARSCALAVAGLLLAAWVKRRYWRAIDGAPVLATVADATGLGRLGAARLLERPHTAPNYLQKEMGFVIARKHAARLRRLVLGGLLLAAALLALAALLPASWAAALAALALLSGMLATLAERWLFFAEATHTVNLYYGAAAV